jgi:8-oxo-dGTP pyrophosphatase MutT (NUDIX family)
VCSTARLCFTSASSASTWSPEPPLAAIEPIRAAEPIPTTDQVPAAVLVPLLQVSVADGPHVVLTRRRTDLRRHAGEISFPGGRRDPEDADLRDTALREAEEEIGLPRDAVSLLGELPPTSTFATNYIIYPFVGLISHGQRWQLSPLEVDAVLELPLRVLGEGRTRTRMERRGISFETDAYVVGEHLIWGATARILENLLASLDTLMPPSRPAPPPGSPTPSRSRRSS